jgi:hypothetical protein
LSRISFGRITRPYFPTSTCKPDTDILSVKRQIKIFCQTNQTRTGYGTLLRLEKDNRNQKKYQKMIVPSAAVAKPG